MGDEWRWEYEQGVTQTSRDLLASDLKIWRSYAVGEHSQGSLFHLSAVVGRSCLSRTFVKNKRCQENMDEICKTWKTISNKNSQIDSNKEWGSSV